MMLHEINLEQEGIRLKIQSKRLSSGKCQVKFTVLHQNEPEVYGYLLSEGNESLKAVVHRIQHRLENLATADYYYHAHLFDLRRKGQINHDILIFNPQ